MAAASVLSNHEVGDRDPDTSKVSLEDRRILTQPYAVALSFMGHDPELIVYAVKLFEKRQKTVEVARLMIQVEDLEDLKKKGRALPPLDQVKTVEEDSYGSDGESSDESLEYIDAIASPSPENPLPTNHGGDDDDLQMDCAEPEMPQKVKAVDQLQEPRLKKVDSAPSPSGKDTTALKRKLLALRSENKRLKERQLCKDCHSRPVSITFLPCGHYSYCYDCGQRFSACPLCRKTILADVKTFLA